MTPVQDDRAEGRRAAGFRTDDDEARRREWRRFVLENHPDRGGDPEVFAAGVRAYREGRSVSSTVPVEQYLTTHRSPRGVGHVTRWVRRRWDGWTRPPRVE